MWPNPQFPADWSHLLKKSLIESCIFCAVSPPNFVSVNYYFNFQYFLKIGLPEHWAKLSFTDQLTIPHYLCVSSHPLPALHFRFVGCSYNCDCKDLTWNSFTWSEHIFLCLSNEIFANIFIFTWYVIRSLLRAIQQFQTKKLLGLYKTFWGTTKKCENKNLS